MTCLSHRVNALAAVDTRHKEPGIISDGIDLFLWGPPRGSPEMFTDIFQAVAYLIYPVSL